MDTKELKFLLKLLGFPDYRASLSKVKPNSKTPVSEVERICRNLRDRDLVACTEEVTKIKSAPPGKALLKLDPAGLPVTPHELKIIKACEKGTITPGKTGVPPAEREALIQNLAHRGFIEVAQIKIKDVWLTEQGKKHLREEYSPSGHQPLFSGEMLNNYLSFMRKFLPGSLRLPPTGDEEILQVIQDLDRQLETDNYLPIFHLREKLQPPMSREELDQTLYRLEQQDKIELSSLQEVRAYTAEQIDAGIPQDIGGPLFFIITT